MRRRSIPAAALALLLVAGPLAGCLGASDGPGPPTTPSNASASSSDATGAPGAPNGSAEDATGAANASTPRRIHYNGCTLLQAIFVAPGPVAPDTPDGFTPAAPAYPGLMGSVATIVVDGHVCSNATSGSLVLEDLREMHLYVLVDPPDRYRSSEIDSYAVEVGGVVTDEALHGIYRSWNLTGVESGQIQSTITRARPAAEQAQMTVDAVNVSARLLTATSGQPGGLQGYNARIFSTADGEVTSVVDIGVDAGTQTTGTAKLALTDLPSGAQNAPAWGLLNGLGTGLVAHQTMDRTWTHRDLAAFE